ncbi:MAG: barstar family protein [Ktedonobacteraceae bacterium]
MMVAFDPTDTSRFQRLDWQILQNGAISLYHNRSIFEEVCEWFHQQQYHLYRFDCTQWTSLNDFHRDVSQTLKFPDYYGQNLDAFNDSLIDIDVPNKSGGLLAFSRFDTFALMHFSFAQTILDIIQDNSRHFLLTGQRLIALVQSDDVDLAFEPVGACPIIRNPVERVNRLPQRHP